MAVANTKSNAITNADASPRVPNNPYIEAGIMRVSVGTVETAAADDDGSVYRMVRIPSNARVHSIRVFCDTITAGTVYDCGLYQTAANGGAALDADCYATNVDLSTAITVGTEIAFEARDIANIEKRVWEDGAVSADPYLEYDICLTGDTVGSAAGTLSLAVIWTV